MNNNFNFQAGSGKDFTARVPESENLAKYNMPFKDIDELAKNPVPHYEDLNGFLKSQKGSRLMQEFL